MHASIKILALFFLVVYPVAFDAQQEAQEVIKGSSGIQFDSAVAALPPPIKAKYISPDSIAAPSVVPLRGTPKVVPAHPNVHLGGAPKVRQIPKNLKVVTLGKNGVPLPTSIAVRPKVVPALQPEPIPAKAFRTMDGAIYDFQYLSDDQGLTNTGVLSIMEDSRGHLWFGTTAGITRYDGNHFFNYTQKEGFPIVGGLRHILEDHQGNIWFSGSGGICYYDGQNFSCFGQEQGLAAERVTAMLEDSEGNIWFDAGDIYRYDGATFTIFKKEHGFENDAEKDVESVPGNRITFMLQDRNGNIWFATQGHGVMRFDGEKITHFTEEEGLIHNYIEHIMEDSEGQIWFSSGGQNTRGQGVSRYNPDDVTNGRNGSFSNFTKAEGLSGNRISRMLEDRSGNIWFATYDGGGASRYDGKFFTHFTIEEGLNFNALLEIMEDRQGNIWFGTNGAGVCRFRPNSFRHFTEEQGLTVNWIGELFEDRSGNIWMGTMYGGVVKYDGHTFTQYTEEEGLLQNVIMGITEDHQGNMWFATRDNGICRFDGKTFMNYGLAQGISWNSWDLFFDTEDQLWVSCGWGGMTRINLRRGEITHFTAETDVTGDAWEGIGGGAVYQDRHQNLWFGGRGYLAKFDPANDEINFTHELEAENKSWVVGMLEDEQDNFWVALGHNLVQVKKRGVEINPDVQQISVEEAFGSQQLNSIVKDRSQNVWLGTSDLGLLVIGGGLDGLEETDLKQIQYSKADGLRSRKYNEKTMLIDSKNRLWFCSTVGATVLDLNTFKLPTIVPQDIGLFDIDVQQYHIDFPELEDTNYQNTFAFGQVLRESFDSVLSFKNYPSSLTLPYDLNHLTFHFSAVDWSAPHQIRYSYKMEGLDEQWSLPTGSTSADYRNLPHGTYTFKVKATGQSGVWSAPFEYAFTIHPPWWHTWWAYLLYVLLTLGAIGGYTRRLRAKIKEKQEQVEREQYLNRELRELNIATDRFVPHDFLKILDRKSLQELKLGDQTHATMTVLFADIRDYTSLSEKMTPEDNFKFINAYLGRMGPIIKEHGGFICQYFGDGIMALFKDNHDMAVKAAVEMQRALQRYNRKRFAHNRKAIEIGIGLNTGQLMLGVIGDQQRYDTSVISDAVNTASRMEGLTKIFGCQVIVSEKTLTELQIFTDKNAPDTLGGDYRFLGKVRVKGREGVVKIYDFYDGETEEIRQLKSSTKAVFEKGMRLYFQQEFGKAADLFKVVLEHYPGDTASNYYMERSVQFIVDGVDERWSGVEEMVSK